MLLSVFMLASCAQNDQLPTFGEEKYYEVPNSSVRYSHLEFGNVICDGKQAVFINFNSDYPVDRVAAKGSLLDQNGNVIYTFDEGITFSSTNKPELPVRIEKELIKSVRSVSFTEIKAYTKNKINFQN